MTLLVPFDGSALSRTALERASEFADYRDEEVVALTIIPDDEEFARERGWIDEDGTYDQAAVCEEFERTVQEVAPNATYRCEHPETSDSMTATVIDDITRTIRHVADDVDASIVFIGSENAGRVSTPVTSVGSPVSEDPRYDVHIVRHAD
ncbi:universal stress protein [Halorientalis regularis]|jgi:nucleotide-binding universal stress UspA family protein|uniref:Universal stress protein family protein n=1 Tax=Halorientalis regularis TaxID=660518 RepID=A0A1G7FHH4_9EURY|nr:universal stress protein [Halorientalis regularis]SDE75390.1 Universal stress protein family protein [Halorientalis regularis]